MSELKPKKSASVPSENDVLRRMLQTPPEKHAKKAGPEKPKRPKDSAK